MVERVYYESKEDAYTLPGPVQGLARHGAQRQPGRAARSYRVKLKDPTQFAQVHDLFCSGRFSDRGKEICNPGSTP